MRANVKTSFYLKGKWDLSSYEIRDKRVFLLPLKKKCGPELGTWPVRIWPIFLKRFLVVSPSSLHNLFLSPLSCACMATIEGSRRCHLR